MPVLYSSTALPSHCTLYAVVQCCRVPVNFRADTKIEMVKSASSARVGARPALSFAVVTLPEAGATACGLILYTEFNGAVQKCWEWARASRYRHFFGEE